MRDDGYPPGEKSSSSRMRSRRQIPGANYGARRDPTQRHAPAPSTAMRNFVALATVRNTSVETGRHPGHRRLRCTPWRAETDQRVASAHARSHRSWEHWAWPCCCARLGYWQARATRQGTAGNAASAIAKNGSHRHLGRWYRARFQQRARRHLWVTANSLVQHSAEHTDLRRYLDNVMLAAERAKMLGGAHSWFQPQRFGRSGTRSMWNRWCAKPWSCSRRPCPSASVSTPNCIAGNAAVLADPTYSASGHHEFMHQRQYRPWPMRRRAGHRGGTACTLAEPRVMPLRGSLAAREATSA